MGGLQLNIVQSRKAAILKITRLLPTATKDMPMKFETEIPKQTWVTLLKACQPAILKLTSLKINRLLPIYISIVPLKFGVDIQSQTKFKSPETKKSNMAARRAFLN